MSIEVKILAVGESTSGVLSAWHKHNGDVVSDGEALFARNRQDFDEFCGRIW
jgi:pyruvate/2-oxoglutarate dehydrogenase complex dihydrolipoamide acyltransferase (E2) component